MANKDKLRSVKRTILVIFGGLFSVPLLYIGGRAGSTTYLPVIFQAWPLPGRVLISEVVFDPLDDEPGGEWVEIFNSGGYPVDLTGYKIGDEEEMAGNEGMLQFPTGLQLPPGGMMVIANQAAVFENRYNRLPDFEMSASHPDVPDLTSYAPWAGGQVELVNSGDEIFLLGPQDGVLDAVSWGKSTWAFDPPASSGTAGHSLERYPANLDTDTASDWISQPAPNPWQVITAQPTVVVSNTPTPSPSPVRTPTPQPSVPGALLISEVYYEAPGDEPDGEWIEIFNRGQTTIVLYGYKLGDEETPQGGEGMVSFPEGLALPPGGVLVVANRASVFQANHGFPPDCELNDSDSKIPDMNKYPDWSSGSLNLNNNGDEVLLLDGIDQVLDALSWGDSTWVFDPAVEGVAEGHSLERRPAYQDSDAAEDWFDQPSPQPGELYLPTPTATPAPSATPTPPSSAETVLVSEIFYDPTENEPQAEWIELYNASGELVDLSGYKIGDEETPGGAEGMVQFPTGASIPAGQWIVIANNASIFTSKYGFKPDYEFSDSDPGVPDLMIYSAWADNGFDLGNSGDEVLLLDSDNQLMDAVSWGTSNWAFEPPAPDVAQDHSLERQPPDIDTDTAVDWTDQATPSPGTGQKYHN